jgi:F-type H+-transporting ATPase subunit epsilon
VKAGTDVFVSVRNAIGGTDIGELRAAVERDFTNRSEQEKTVRRTLDKLESGLVRRLIEFDHG